MTDPYAVHIEITGTIETNRIGELLAAFPDLHILNVHVLEYTGLTMSTDTAENNGPNI
jgi:hypothetical protein